MKRPLLFVLAVFFLGCHHKPPGPPPTPPPPTPPPALGILTRQGNQFLLAGKPFVWQRATSCCDGTYLGWPLMTPAGLDQLAANHVTGSHWRLGPYGVDPTHPELLPYALVGAAPRPKEPSAAEPLILIALRGERLRGHPLGGPRAPVTHKIDLTKWNPAFWNLVRSDAVYANQHGVIPEIDLADGGCSRLPIDPMCRLRRGVVTPTSKGLKVQAAR